MRTQGFTLGLIDAQDNAIVGGKAINLGRLIRAGFPVPGGFVVTTRAYRFAQSAGSHELPAEVAEEIRVAYRAMGAGTVAVRSSATAEDMGNASMAGQYETFLDIEGEEKLLEAVGHCWASLDSPRIRAYLNEHGIDPARVTMAVVVQRLVKADVAGVLFTVNPNESAVGDGSREMLVEASWGLGESVVSGRVQPDVLRLEQESGRVIAATIADKRVALVAGRGGEQAVEESRRRQPCLRGKDVHRLWQLGRRAVAHFGAPQDIEWAIHDGELYLLQSRPITTREDAEAYEAVLRVTREHLRKELASGRGPWALHNLAETLPHPTPLTWSVIQRFMSGAGGFGNMYRAAGFEPSAMVEHAGFLERIAGRVYMDAARAPEMFFADFPFAYELAELRRSPDVSQTPPTRPTGTMRDRVRAGRRLAEVNQKLHASAGTLDKELRGQLFPAIEAYVKQAKGAALETLTIEQLVEAWHAREKDVLDTFGPRLLLPSLISGMALGELKSFLEENFWEEDADALAQTISSGGEVNRTLLADAALFEVGKGSRPLEEWLKAHGHRASGEFDLAAARWRERPEAAREMAALLAKGDGPMERFSRHGAEVAAKVEALRAKLSGAAAREMDRHVELLRRYVTFREDGKDLLMLGYDLLRDVAREAGRRLEIGEDVFFLTREDLFDALRVGFAPHQLIEERKRAYRAEGRMTLPRVIDGADIEALGQAAEVKVAANGKGHVAFAISSGAGDGKGATGPVRIRKSPTDAGDLGTGYILVCPSTDPSWTPLFVNAAGLILECGGTLSHGAVVAREMGLPAVVLPDATRIFSEGEEIHIDGRIGWVGRPSEKPAADATQKMGEEDAVPREWIPPAPGRKDRAAGRLRNIFAGAWILYLLALFLLPRPWVYQPTMRLLDGMLWPIARISRPLVVVVVAGVLAVATLLLQKLLTDNRRLFEAKRRAAVLRVRAAALPSTSGLKKKMLALAAPVQWRLLAAALVPVGVLLGPMLMPFVWFKERIDPAVMIAPAGAPVQVVATFDSSVREPVTLIVEPGLTIDETTPAERRLPPIRETLARLLTLYKQPRVDPAAPWEMQVAPDVSRQQTADDLQAYLDAGVPAQSVTWLVRTPEGASDRFNVKVRATGKDALAAPFVVGDKFAPEPLVVEGRAGGVIKQVRFEYPMTKADSVFWRPFAGIVKSGFLATWDIGWLWIYILVYLPLVMIVRALLRVA